MTEVKAKRTFAKLQPGQKLKALYRSWLYTGDAPRNEDNFPEKLYVVPELEMGGLSINIKHGRHAVDDDMSDALGFDGPTFYCRKIECYGDRLHLLGVDDVGIRLAETLQLNTDGEDIAIKYVDHDLLEVTSFRDGKPAYFGEFVINANWG